jgi:hypothetical protein
MNTNAKRGRPVTVRRDRDHLEKLLDQALADSFPASDPIAVNFETPTITETKEDIDDIP